MLFHPVLSPPMVPVPFTGLDVMGASSDVGYYGLFKKKCQEKGSLIDLIVVAVAQLELVRLRSLSSGRTPWWCSEGWGGETTTHQ